MIRQDQGVEIVTTHSKPWRRCWPDALPSPASAFWRWAEARGVDVAARTCERAVQVGIARDGVLLFRATWIRSDTTERWTAQRVALGRGLVTLTAAKETIA